MKKFINKVIVVAFLIIVFNGITQSVITQELSQEVRFYLELIVCVILICGCQFLTNLFKSRYYALEMLVEYLAVCAIVAVCGLVFAWFSIDDMWRVIVYVTPVYIVTYFLGISRTKKEVEDINSLIRLRNERKQDNE